MFAPKSPPHFPLLSTVGTLTLASWLIGCSKPPEKVEEIRPVRVLVAQGSKADMRAEFSGDVRARVESQLAFRVPGKIVKRLVDVGALVHKGQLLMQLDAQDLQLAQAQAGAALRATQTNFDLAQAELKRYQELRDKNFVSQAVLDSKVSAFKAAQANVESAQAALRGQSNQTGYSTLVADVDGVVTAVDAEVGQVVAAGTPVVKVAKAGEKEVVIGLPEDKVDALRAVSDVQVRMWAAPEVLIPGKIREISPSADAQTRTYAARIAIPDSATGARLGMTALVQFSSSLPREMVRLPLMALFYDKQQTSVWLVEGGKVRLVPVQVATASGNEILLAAGVNPGQSVVTAGVNMLKPGQKVTILGQEAVAGSASSAAPGSASGSASSAAAASAATDPATGAAAAAEPASGAQK